MIWQKFGLLTKPTNNIPWLNMWASASCLADEINSEDIRIFITGREKNGASRIGSAIFTPSQFTITEISKKPCISLGNLGLFDEHGTSYPTVIHTNDTYFLYYTGWVRGASVPWYNALGLAISKDGIHFKKYSDSPIFDRNPADPIGIGSCCVIKENNVWKMWYTSFVRWEKSSKQLQHYYHIKYATSHNGINWIPTGNVCIDFKDSKEYAIAKPTVIKLNNSYIMWYSYRGDTYRIGSAVSKDGITWNRIDKELGLNPSKEGWDSEMVCYPYVCKFNDNLLMFYNGNGYGNSGLGIAIAKTNAVVNFL